MSSRTNSKVPKLTEKQRKHRLSFAKEHKNWTKKDWQRVLWSDESPFELFHSPNRQNDRVWAADGSDVPDFPTVKHPAKVHVWGTRTFRAFSELHVVAGIIKDDHKWRVLSSEHSGRSVPPGDQPISRRGDGAPARTHARSKRRAIFM